MAQAVYECYFVKQKLKEEIWWSIQGPQIWCLSLYNMCSALLQNFYRTIPDVQWCVYKECICNGYSQSQPTKCMSRSIARATHSWRWDQAPNSFIITLQNLTRSKVQTLQYTSGSRAASSTTKVWFHENLSALPDAFWSSHSGAVEFPSS